MTVHGLLPIYGMDAATHEVRCLEQLRSKTSPLEKYIYLQQLKDADAAMFYHLCLKHMDEITPLIYTPTVGDACLQFSHIFRRPDGLFITLADKGRISEILSRWPLKEQARISVVTDGSRILGLGDLGANGMPISIGKLSLYIAGAGFRPESTIPICLDLGTNNEEYLNDPLYIGSRQKRGSSEEMTAFLEEFMEAMRTQFPKLLVQFEDFSTDNAFKYLRHFRDRYRLFNDDIQGTGAVVLSGFINAAKISSEASGRSLTDHRILFFGAGSAGIGVATQLMSFFTIHGLSKEEARDMIYLADSQGLVYDQRGKIAEHKKYFSRKDYTGPPITNLLDILDYVKPTALFGLSTTAGAFTPEVIRSMTRLNPRPIIFPLSNPVRLSECTFEEAVIHSNGKVLFASGSPFDSLPNPANPDQILHPGQGNNMYIFPGLGLAAVLAQVSTVTDEMVEASALGLAESLDEEERKAQMLYPILDRIRQISVHIARRVIRQAQKENVDGKKELRALGDGQLDEWIAGRMWNP